MVKTMMSMALPPEGIKTVRQDQPDRAGLAAPAPGPQRVAREVVIPARLLVDGDSGARILARLDSEERPNAAMEKLFAAAH